jgi:glycosyltransferase XagB
MKKLLVVINANSLNISYLKNLLLVVKESALESNFYVKFLFYGKSSATLSDYVSEWIEENALPGNVVYDCSINTDLGEAGVINSGNVYENIDLLRKTSFLEDLTDKDLVCFIDFPSIVSLDRFEKVLAHANKFGFSYLKRVNEKSSLIRKVVNFFFSLRPDLDYGLLVLKKEVINNLPSNIHINPAIFYMISVELGYDPSGINSIGGEPVWSEKKEVYVLKDLVRTKRSTAKPKIINHEHKSGEGSGFAYNRKRFVTHTNLPPEKSAIVPFTLWQKTLLFMAVLFLTAGLIVDIKLSLIVLISFLTFLYFIDLIFSSYVLSKSFLSLKGGIEINSSELASLKDSQLPVYTILCPLYKEAEVLEQFIASINNLDWPKDKLDVILLFEEDDKETIDVSKNIKLPGHFRIEIVPHSYPKTKPKACNWGFLKARGKYLVIYDAEDKPEADQLKKAYLAFKKLPPNVVCLQSKLNYYNSNQNLLTKLFTAEYSLWFDLILPGLQRIRTIIPLGGTSNHFKHEALKYLKGWDPFNVTEDCDLGTRLFLSGFRTEIIDSTTFEEANSSVNGFIKQRSRWIKGYLQTYLVHMRSPYKFFKNLGIHMLLFQAIIGMRMTFILINPIMWMMTITYFSFRETLGPAIESLFLTPVFYIAIICLVVGNFIHFYNYMIGLAVRERWDLIKYVFFIPFYWILISIAGLKAFYQLIFRPYYWEKTTHGLHLSGVERAINIIPELNISINPSFSLKGLISPVSKINKSIKRFGIETVDLFRPLKPEFGKNSKNILFFNWRDTKHKWAGGAEVYIHEISKRLAAKGVGVTIFCGWDGVSKRDDLVDGVRIIRRGGIFTVYLYAIFYKMFKMRGKFDLIIDCENGIPFFTPLYSNTPKILLIHHIHQEVLRSKLKFPFSQIGMFLEKIMMPIVYSKSNVVTISKSSKNEIEALSQSFINRVSIVNPGIVVENAIYPKTKNPSMLYLGRLKSYKNVDMAIRAYKTVLSSLPDLSFTIAGSGDDEKRLKRIAKKLGVLGKINFTGYVNNREKHKLLSESWICVQPSSYEGWGITVIEANAHGTPVVASDIGGLRDSVIDGETGLLFEEGNLADLTLSIEKIIATDTFRQYLSENALKWSENFSWDSSAELFLETIKNITGPDLILSDGLAISAERNFK